MALSAKRRVFFVSARLEAAGDTVAISAVRELPPSDVLSRCVSLESRYLIIYIRISVVAVVVSSERFV